MKESLSFKMNGILQNISKYINKHHKNDDIQCKTPLCNSWLLPLPTIVSFEPLLCESPPLMFVICSGSGSGSDPIEASVISTLYTDALLADLELPLL